MLTGAKRRLFTAAAAAVIAIVCVVIVITVIGQSITPPVPLPVTIISNITATTIIDCPTVPTCIDNRSQQYRRNNYHSFRATGTGTWSVQMKYADGSPTNWTSFGASGLVTNSGPVSGVGYGIGYHDFIAFTIIGSASVLNYSSSKNYWTAGVTNTFNFPISTSQGGMIGYVDAVYGSATAACAAAGSGNVILVLANQDFNGTCSGSILAYGGGGFCPATGHTATLGGGFDGDLTQHFSLTCGGSFATTSSFSVKAMYPQYWGIVPSTSTDNTVKLQAAIDGITNMGIHTMTFPPNGGTYAFTHLQTPSDTKLDCGPGLPGADTLVKATLKGLSATSMIGYGMQAVTNVNHATVTWVSGDKFDKTVLTSAGNSIVFAGIPTFHAYTIVSVDSPTQLTISIASHDPGVQPNQATNMRVDGNAVTGCQINGNNLATAGIIMYDGGAFPQVTDNYFISFPFASSNAAIKGGAVLYGDFQHNAFTTTSRGLDIISAYSSSNSGQPCGFCTINRNYFFTAGVRFNGLAVHFDYNDLEGESAESPWANIDLSQGVCESCSVNGNYTEDACSSGNPCNWIYGTVDGPIAIEHNTIFGNRSGLGNKTLALHIIGQANGIRDNYITGWDYDFGIVASNNNTIYLDESNTMSYAVAQIEYSTAGGFIPPYYEDGGGSVNLNQMHLVDDANGLLGRIPNGLTCIGSPVGTLRLGCGSTFRLDTAGTFTGGTYPFTSTPRNGSFYMYSSTGSVVTSHGGVNTTGLFNFSAQHSFTVPNHYPLLMMVETTGTVSEVKSSQDIPTTYAVMNTITCNAANEGVHFPITDSNVSTFNATITGSGANHGMAWCNGTDWKFR